MSEWGGRRAIERRVIMQGILAPSAACRPMRLSSMTIEREAGMPSLYRGWRERKCVWGVCVSVSEWMGESGRSRVK